jgi:hypothetical protein
VDLLELVVVEEHQVQVELQVQVEQVLHLGHQLVLEPVQHQDLLELVVQVLRQEVLVLRGHLLHQVLAAQVVQLVLVVRMDHQELVVLVVLLQQLVHLQHQDLLVHPQLVVHLLLQELRELRDRLEQQEPQDQVVHLVSLVDKCIT